MAKVRGERRRQHQGPGHQQDPVVGTQVEVNSTVTITVNQGPETGTVPDGLVGKDRNDVEDRLDEAGFSNRSRRRPPLEPIDSKAGRGAV